MIFFMTTLPEQRCDLETLEYSESEPQNKMKDRSKLVSKRHFATGLADLDVYKICWSQVQF